MIEKAGNKGLEPTSHRGAGVQGMGGAVDGEMVAGFELGPDMALHCRDGSNSGASNRGQRVVVCMTASHPAVMSTYDFPMPYPGQNLTPAARRSAQRRAARDRSQRYREKLKAERLPTAREIDRALSEALAFVTRRGVIVDGRPKIDVGDIVTVAALILKRDGKNHLASLSAVAERMAYRADHTQPSWMPSTRPKTPALLLPPQGDNGWTDADVAAVKAAMERPSGKVTTSPTESASTPVTSSYAVTGR